MFKNKSKKVRRMIGAVAVSAVTLCSMAGIKNVFASDITSGTWCVYYNSPGSYSTFDYVTLTVRKNSIYSAKCTTLDNKNLAVDFTENSITPAGDGSLIFTGTGIKRFKFIDIKDGVDSKVYFRIKRSGNATGLARGSAIIGTY